MRLSPILGALVLLLAGAGRALAGINSRAGTSSAQFLKLGAGARAGAMGESYSAVADDVYAVYYNPAGLTAMTHSELAASHTALFSDISYDIVAFAYPMGRSENYSQSVLAVSIYSLGISGIERRTEDTLKPSGNFNASDTSYNLTYARRLSETISVGGTGKLISLQIDSYKATAFAVDGGLRFTPRPNMSRSLALSLVVKNIGSAPKFAGISDPLPLALVAGIGYEVVPKTFRFNVDVTKYRDTDAFFALGGEYRRDITENMGGALRFGMTTHRADNEGLTEVTAGAGLRFNRVSFDFAWVPFGALGNSFRYSLQLRF